MHKTHNSLQNQPNLKMSAQMNTVSDHGTEESVSYNQKMGTYNERPQSKHDTEISLNNFSQFQVEGQKPHSCMSESNDSVQMYDEMRLNVVNPGGSSSYTHHQVKNKKHMKYDVAATSEKYTEKSIHNS